jgi:hypothetical protein
VLNSTANGHNHAYENAACDVLAALYFDNVKIAPAEYQYELRPVLFPTPQLGLLFKTLCDLNRVGANINDNTILSRIGSEVDAAWLGDVLNVYTPQVGQAFESNCELVLKYGIRAGASRITKIMSQQLDDPVGKSTEMIISQGTDILTGLRTDAQAKSVQANEVGDDLDAYIDAPAEKTIQTGIEWLDSLSGGFYAGDIWMVAGAYKMRKTTLMLNMCLNAALNGASVTFLSREMSKRQVAAQLISMLAVGDLIAHGEYEVYSHDLRTNTDYYLNWISPRKLLLARADYRRWDPRKVRAIDNARLQFKAIGDRLRIYDSSPEGGGLNDIVSAQLAIKRDLFLYQTELVFVDYLQLFEAPGNSLFDKTSYSSHAFQEIGKRDSVTMAIAAQRNEEAIKNDLFNYSPGIKGGGDAAAVADFALQTRYKHGQEADENELEISVTLSRHGSGGGDTKQVVPIHPNSGLLLDSDFANTCKIKAGI